MKYLRPRRQLFSSEKRKRLKRTFELALAKQEL
jgi:hypothetical protein